MTPARALGAAVMVVTVVQCAMLWSGTLAAMAVGLLLAASREDVGR